jgi:hypothetical protein
MDTEPTPETPRPGRPRRIGSWVLLVLGALLVILSVASIWVRNVLLDTDRYVDTVAPLARDEAIQAVAARQVTDALMGSIDVEGTVADLLPGRATALAPAIDAAVEQLVLRTSQQLFASDQFQTLWDAANRTAHTQIGALLTGGGDILGTEEGRVTVDLQAIAGEVRLRLADRGLTIFDPVPITQLGAKLEIVESDNLAAAQGAVDLLQKAAFVLPLLMVAAFAGAVLLAADRRRGVWRVGIAVAVSMGVLMVTIALGRRFYLDALGGTIDTAAAQSVFDILTRYLRMAIRFLFGLGLLIALGVWATGTSPSALKVRSLLGAATGKAGTAMADGEAPGGFATWVADHRRGVRTGVALVLAFLAMTADHPSLRTLLLALVIGGALFAVIAAIAARVDAYTGTASPAEPPAEPASASASLRTSK